MCTLPVATFVCCRVYIIKYPLPHMPETDLCLLFSRKLAQRRSSWQPMTSHVVVADGENLAHNKFIHAEGAGMKQFIHGPMADINDSVQYYALEDSIINK